MRRLALALVSGLILLLVIATNGSNLPASDQAPALSAQDHDSCIVDLTGDVDASGDITSSDVIFMVNYVFRLGVDPLPCAGSGNVNCSSQGITSADIIYLVFYVFKSGLEPCDICQSETAVWLGCIQ